MTSPAAPVEHHPALLNAPERLAREFRGTYGPETIERFLHTSLDEFLKNASVTPFLPLLAERFARQRLQALAKVEGQGSDARPTVLFLCVHNAGRSQMALGLFQHLAGDAAVGWSGGSEPGSEINPVVVQAMKERGIDIAEEFPKPWTDETVRAADVVITMGCGVACRHLPRQARRGVGARRPRGPGTRGSARDPGPDRGACPSLARRTQRQCSHRLTRIREPSPCT